MTKYGKLKRLQYEQLEVRNMLSLSVNAFSTGSVDLFVRWGYRSYDYPSGFTLDPERGQIGMGTVTLTSPKGPRFVGGGEISGTAGASGTWSLIQSEESPGITRYIISGAGSASASFSRTLVDGGPVQGREDTTWHFSPNATSTLIVKDGASWNLNWSLTDPEEQVLSQEFVVLSYSPGPSDPTTYRSFEGTRSGGVSVGSNAGGSGNSGSDSESLSFQWTVRVGHPFKFGDSDHAFAPNSNFLSLWGTGPAASHGFLCFYDVTNTLLTQQSLSVASDGFWEVVTAPPSSAVRAELWSTDPHAIGSSPDDVASIALNPHLPLSEVQGYGFTALRKGDVLMSLGKAVTSDYLAALYGGIFSHAWLFVGPDAAGTPMIVQAPGPFFNNLVERVPLDDEAANCRSIEVYRLAGPELSFAQETQIANTAGTFLGTQFFGGLEWALFYSFKRSFDNAANSTDPTARQLFLDEATQKASRLGAIMHSKTRVVCSTLVWHIYHDALGVDLYANHVAPHLTSFAKTPSPKDAALALLASQGALIVPDALATDGELQLVIAGQSSFLQSDGNALYISEEMPATKNTITSARDVALAYYSSSARGGVGCAATSRGYQGEVRNDTSRKEHWSVVIADAPARNTRKTSGGHSASTVRIDGTRDEEPVVVKNSLDSSIRKQLSRLTKTFFGLTICFMVCAASATCQQCQAGVIVESRVRWQNGRYAYEYVVNNQAIATITDFTVDVFGLVGDLQSPSNWAGDSMAFAKGIYTVSWYSSLPGAAGVPPGGTLGGFSFTSSFGPGQVTYTALDNNFNGVEGTTVGPSLAPGDYDTNGSVDGNDFVVWRQTFGSLQNLAADGNRNGRVDAADYVIWRNSLKSIGDYNSDGVVNALDYETWRSSINSSNVAADGNRDGIVDAADYVLWRNQSGTSNTSMQSVSIAVPEANTLSICGLAGVLGVLGGRLWKR